MIPVLETKLEISQDTGSVRQTDLVVIREICHRCCVSDQREFVQLVFFLLVRVPVFEREARVKYFVTFDDE